MYTVTKTTVECYKIRQEKGHYWADITIDAGEGRGRIQIASDFGNYQHYWGATDKSFKTFLSKIGIHYAAGKFGADKWFDHEQTVKLYKTQIIEHRRCLYLDADQAREIFEEIKELVDCYQRDMFEHTLLISKKLMNFYDHCPPMTESISPQFKNFWKEIWPVFLEELERENLVTA